MGKSKPFIDKKRAVTFALVSRPHDDPSGFEKDNVRLWPDDELASVSGTRTDDRSDGGIFFKDGYDYLKHIKDRTFECSFDRLGDTRSEILNWDKQTVDGQYDDAESNSAERERFYAVDMSGNDYNALKANAAEGPGTHWDPEIIETLRDDFTDFDEDFEDDFVALAMSDQPLESATDDGTDHISDWFARQDEHKRSAQKYFLDKKDREAEDSDEYESCGESSNDDVRTKSEKSRFTEYSMTSSAVPRNPYQSELDDHFEQMFADYDDTEIGALDHEEISGKLSAEKSAVLKVIEHGFKCPIEKPLVLPDEVVKLREIDLETDSDREITDEDLFGKETPKGEWDCESILSTYSNIYNRPKVISCEKKVKLSKAGIPISSNDRVTSPQNDLSDYLDRMKYIPPNVRRKDETKEETRARQKIQKEEKRLRRMEKKSNKIAFKIEDLKQKSIEMNKNNSSGIKL